MIECGSGTLFHDQSTTILCPCFCEDLHANLPCHLNRGNADSPAGAMNQDYLARPGGGSM